MRGHPASVAAPAAASTSSSSSSSSRFSLLLLDHGELLLETAACTFRVEDLRDVDPSAADELNGDAGLQLGPAIVGRLWIATRSLTLEPAAVEDGPVLRMPFRQMPCEPADDVGEANTIAARFRRVVKQNARAPYQVKDFALARSSVVTPKHTKAERLTTLMRTLWMAAQQQQQQLGSGGGGAKASASGPVEQLPLLEQTIIRPRLSEPFDRSRLVDFRERILLPTLGAPSSSSSTTTGTIAVERLDALVSTPGCLVLTDKRVYFQPSRLNNLSGTRLCAVWELAKLSRFAKRRYLMQPRGLELVIDTTAASNSHNNNNGSIPSSSASEGGNVAFSSSSSLSPSATSSSIFLAFREGESRDEFHNRLAELLPSLAHTSERRQAEMLRRWQRREASNFEYLSFLNAEADRSVHDLAQYPVFPWVLQDYTSPVLNLDDPASFRDLSKPIGAFNPARLEQFKARFASLQDQHDVEEEEGDASPSLPPFLYGTHYSTPGFVLFYLVRERAEQMLHLQGGRFDAPDRMFWSVGATWDSVLSNPADVKELIPEFFEGTGGFLLNVHRLELGRRQGGKGKRVYDVELPPWASSPADFLHKMRSALESDAVSTRLHLWIDLIFGCKQRSVEADNVFFHLTYEGAVDFSRLNGVERAALETQVMEFGQTPKQLFVDPHPPRGGYNVSLASEMLSMATIPVTAAAASSSEAPANVSSARRPASANNAAAKESTITTSMLSNTNAPDVLPTLALDVRMAITTPATSDEDLAFAPSLMGPSASPLSSVHSTSNTPRLTHHVIEQEEDGELHRRWEGSLVVSETLEIDDAHPRGEVTQVCINGNANAPNADKTNANLGDVYSCSQDGSLALFTRQGKLVRRVGLSTMGLTCLSTMSGSDLLVGSLDNALYRYSLATGRVVQRVEAHDDAVSCVSSMTTPQHSNRCVVATGGWDAAIKVWTASEGGALEASCALFGHECEVADVALNESAYLVLSSGSRDGRVLLHDVRRGHAPVWQAFCGHAGPSKLAWVSTQAKAITCSALGGVKLHDLRRSSGDRGLDAVVRQAGQGTAWRPSALATDGQRVLVGDGGGRITLGRLEELESIAFESSVFVRHKDGSRVSCIAVGSEMGFVASGTASGRVGIHQFT